MNQIKFFQTLCYITLFIGISSCFSNSNGHYSDTMVGNWTVQLSKSTDAAQILSQYEMILEKSGEGKQILKSSTTFSRFPKLNNSWTIENPLKWKTGNNIKGDYLAVNYGNGRVINVNSSEKERIKREQFASENLMLYNGMTDTIYFTIEDNGKVKWQHPPLMKEFQWVRSENRQ